MKTVSTIFVEDYASNRHKSQNCISCSIFLYEDNKKIEVETVRPNMSRSVYYRVNGQYKVIKNLMKMLRGSIMLKIEE